jgi:GGDEF domain-containing protein
VGCENYDCAEELQWRLLKLPFPPNVRRQKRAGICSVAGTSSTDPVTGLINRRELKRQIEAHRLHGAAFSLLLFELSGPLSDQVLLMAASKLATQFRHSDRVARWSDKELAVLFLGENELAQTRATQVIPRAAGHYRLDNGETVLIAVRARRLQPELATA